MKMMNYNTNGDRGKVLITSGWHGDEPDGIEILNTFDFDYRFFDHLNIFTINEINEWGCRYRSRTDRNGLSPDDGFIKRDEQYQQVMSVEAKTIKTLEDYLKGFNVHISLHNDPKREGFYFYTWGHCDELERVGSEYYEGFGVKRTFDTQKNLKDGSYYDYMLTRYGQKSIIIESGIYSGSSTDMKLVLGRILSIL